MFKAMAMAAMVDMADIHMDRTMAGPHITPVGAVDTTAVDMVVMVVMDVAIDDNFMYTFQ